MTVDLRCRWLGLDLRSPLVVGASPLADRVEVARRLVDAGAGAVVVRSLFEEQILADQVGAFRYLDSHVDTDAEAATFLPETGVFSLGAGPAQDRIRVLVDELDVPVVASLNGVTPGGWTDHAAELVAAGAAALELNLYDVATDAAESGAAIEARQLEVVRSVVAGVDVPVTVKLSPFYASVPHFVARLAEAGAAGVAVFNRFYQPDIDLETLDVDRRLDLSTPVELPLRLHALAVLYGRAPLSLAATGGVHHGTDAAKAILCGADVVQVVSAVLRDGPGRLAVIREELVDWLEGHGYRDLEEARGATSFDNVANPHELERANYAHLLQTWQAPSWE